MELATITGLCLWAIVLELQIRRREHILNVFANAFTATAYGKAKITVENGKPTIKYNTGE
jgi:hypothetical protein